MLTITVNATGGGVLAAGTATASILTPPSTTGSFVGSPTCNYTGGAATASCTVTITSAVAGTTTVQATSSVGFTNATGNVTRTTGTATNVTAGCTANCGNANKAWGDVFIQISPQNASNAVGTNHVLTITVNATGGTLVSGTATASILTPPSTTGSFVGSPTCSYTGGAATASCTVTITSAVAGTTTVQATSAIALTGIPAVTRTTGTVANTTAGCATNCGNANKTWVDGFIQIAPQNASNAVGTNHVLTITVNATNGGVLAAGTATASIITPPSTTGSFVGSPSCNYAGGAATATCTVTITSAVSGTTQVQATSTIGFTNATGTVSRTTGTATNVTAGCTSNCANANKTWVDGFIQITPQNANNPVSTNHVLTITVNATNGGVLAAGTATASIITPPSTTGSFVGSPTCNYAGGAATATCTVTITSTVSGLTQVQATSTIGFTNAAGTVSRTTGTASNVTAGCLANCNNANKNWGDVTVVTNVKDATNATVTTVNAGTVVHDEATVTKTAGTPAGVPAPTGTVTFTLFSGDCTTGTVQATDPNEPLSAGGVADSTTFTTSATGSFAYQARYNGDANYPAATGACEPFTVAGNFAGCTPGFWKNHESLWDSLSDPAVSAMPAGLRFTTTTTFNSYFGLTLAQSPFNNNATMHDAISAGGGGPKALARHAVAALLSVGAGLNYQFPPGATDFTSLYNVIKAAYVSGHYEPLATQLAAANNLEFNCSSLVQH